MRAGIDLGDAQAVAHRGVGGRAAPLAEDALAARELHDVVDGEEVGLVLQLGDERQLVLHQRARLVDVHAAAGGEVAAPAERRLRREARGEAGDVVG